MTRTENKRKFKTEVMAFAGYTEISKYIKLKVVCVRACVISSPKLPNVL